MLAEQAQPARDDAAPPVRAHDDAGAQHDGPRAVVREHSLDHTVALEEARHPGALAHLGAGGARGLEQSRVERQAPEGEARALPAPVLPPEAGPVGRDESHPAQRVRPQGRDGGGGADAVEQAPGLGRDALPADLVAGKAGGVEDEDIVAPLAQEAGEGRAGGARAHDHHVARVAAHQRSGSPARARSATATRR